MTCPSYTCECGPCRAKLVERSRSGAVLCPCRPPLDFSVQNGAGPVSSTDCSKCGRQLPGQPRRYPDTAVDREVIAMWNQLQREFRQELGMRRGGDGVWRESRTRTRALEGDVAGQRAEELLEATAENGDRPLTPGSNAPPHMTASHVDAARFVEWVDRQALKFDERDQKKVSEWRRGSRPRIKIETADRILTGVGSHLSELPDGVFTR